MSLHYTGVCAARLYVTCVTVGLGPVVMQIIDMDDLARASTTLALCTFLLLILVQIYIFLAP